MHNFNFDITSKMCMCTNKKKINCEDLINTKIYKNMLKVKLINTFNQFINDSILIRFCFLIIIIVCVWYEIS